MAFSFNKTTTQYTVNSPERYSLSSTFECTKLGCYSIDKDRTIYNNDTRELRRLKTNYEQLLGSDLSVGFDGSGGDDIPERPFDAFLHWIEQNKDNLIRKEDGTGGNKRCKRLVDDDDLFSASIYLAINVVLVRFGFC